MTRIGRLLAGLGAAAALAGCGGVQSVVEAGAGAPEPVPTRGTCEIFVGKPYTVGRDPDCGLTDKEIEAKHEAAWDAQQKRYREWIASDYVRGLDPRKLPQVETLVHLIPGWPSLVESVGHADLAVLGTVVKTTFVENGAETTFRVERTAKGSPSEHLTIHQWPQVEAAYDADHGGLNYKKAELTINPEAPMLFVGDRAVLLLERQPDLKDAPDSAVAGQYCIQGFSGHYLSTNGRVHTVKDNQFHDVDGLTEDALMDRIATYA